MSASGNSDNDLIDHLCRHSPLTVEQARQVVAEVNHYYRESLAEYVCRRHKELQQQGYSNSVIYSELIDELPARRFAQEPLSERQIRRLIYG
jgi:polyhydroxyalkanoate synthesis regulator phasin